MHITFVRAFLPQLDSRMNKYVRIVKQQGNTVSFIGWRKGDAQVKDIGDPLFLFNKAARLGAGWRNALALATWNIYLIRTLFKLRKETSVVHAVDLDSGLAAYIFCRLTRKPLIFDIYDHYADTRSIKGFPRKIICAVERYLAKHSDLSLLADESRYRQHGLQPADNILVIENVPDVTITPKPFDISKDTPLRLGYFGVFEPQHRGLEKLIDSFSGRSDIELHFGGYGQLAPTIISAAKQHSNIYHHGPLSHAQGLELMATMHCIIGFYYLSIPNHRYAAPNKYYEHLLLGRPLLTNIGTPPGDRVSKDESGWSIDETTEALHAWYQSVAAADIIKRGKKAHEIWDLRYKDYSSRTLGGLYYSKLKALVLLYA